MAKIDDLRVLLHKSSVKKAELEERMVSIKASVSDGIQSFSLTDEDLANLDNENTLVNNELTTVESELETLNNEIVALEAELEAEESKINKKITERSDMKMKKYGIVSLLGETINIRSEEPAKLEGVSREGNDVLISTEVIKVDNELALDELQNLITVKSTDNGIATIIEGEVVRTGLYKEEELAKNKELKFPTYKETKKEVETYRGQLTLSQEFVMDAKKINVEQEILLELKINSIITRNRAIKEAFSEFKEIQVADLKALKNALLTGTKGAVKKTLLVNETALSKITDLTYEDGRFVFIPDPRNGVYGHLFGVPVQVVADETLGDEGTPVAVLLGKNAITLYDRYQLGASWFVNEYFAKRLGAFDRFLVHVSNKKAGARLTLNFQ